MTTYSYAEHLALYPDLSTAQRQRLGVEPSGLPLNDDGIVGPKTRSGIFISPRHTHELLDVALRPAVQGAKEEGNNRGAWPALFFGVLDALPEQDAARWRAVEQGPWCAAFASWVIREAYGPGHPQAWGARRLVRRWAEAPGWGVSLAEAQAGDLIAWRRDVPGQPAAGHVGIVWGRSEGGLLLVLEGNGSRRAGAVGLYGYRLRDGAKRGALAVELVARRADVQEVG